MSVSILPLAVTFCLLPLLPTLLSGEPASESSSSKASRSLRSLPASSSPFSLRGVSANRSSRSSPPHAQLSFLFRRSLLGNHRWPNHQGGRRVNRLNHLNLLRLHIQVWHRLTKSHQGYRPNHLQPASIGATSGNAEMHFSAHSGNAQACSVHSRAWSKNQDQWFGKHVCSLSRGVK